MARTPDQRDMQKPASTDAAFTGDIPRFYDSTLVPLIFARYARELARRAAGLHPNDVLEIACGTGVVTRELTRVLPEHTRIVASDLNHAMVAYAKNASRAREVDWRQADVMTLPFAKASFDVVLCEFGVMFFPDRVHAYRNVRNVLRPGGTFLFNSWSRIEENEFADVITQALALRYPADPPLFLARTPHGYGDPSRIEEDVRAAGFTLCDVNVQEERSVAPDAYSAAAAYCYGTPLRGEIERRDGEGLEAATRQAADALRARFGEGQIDGKISAVVVSAA
jgi:ubiquinone/menaquinone biosynthesis C-methylase UbiE